MREKSVRNANTGSFWATSFLFSLVQELVPLFNVELEKFDGLFLPLACHGTLFTFHSL